MIFVIDRNKIAQIFFFSNIIEILRFLKIIAITVKYFDIIIISFVFPNE